MQNPFTQKQVSFTGGPGGVAMERRMAEVLARDNKMPTGGMVGGIYVPPSWTQQLSQALNPMMAKQQFDAANEHEQTLLDREEAKRLAELARVKAESQAEAAKRSQELQAFSRALQGTPAETMGPDEFGPPQPGVPGSKEAAMRVLASSSDPALQKMYMAQALKGMEQQQPIKVGNTLLDPKTYEPIYTAPGGGADAPSNIREWNEYQKMTPVQQEQYLAMKRAAAFKDYGPGFSRMSQTGNFAPQTVLTKDLSPEQQPEVKAAQTAAIEKAKSNVDKDVNRPKVENALTSQKQKVEMLDDLIDGAKKEASIFTTGMGGSVLSGVPGTPAYDLEKQLSTIKANIGFDRLQEMRDNSKTGGALGQVSEMENKLLQSVWGNLEQSQSKEQFIKNLDRVKKQVRASWDRVNRAYEQDYGTTPTGDDWQDM